MVVDRVRADTVVLWDHFPKLKAWRESLAVMRPGAQFTRAFKKEQWDGKDRPGRFKKVDGAWCLILGRGWLDRIRVAFPDAEVREGYNAKPLMLCLDLPKAVSEGEYQYQRRTLELIQNRRWGRVALATNAGKGAIMALAAVNAFPEQVVILCNEVSVFQALQGEFETWAPEERVGLVEAGAQEPPTERVVIAMVQTLHNRLYEAVKEPGSKKPTYVPVDGPWTTWANSVYMALCDEADLATGDVYTRVLEALPNTEYRVGFSGSFQDPDTHDDRMLEDTLGPVLIRVKNQTLVERGISAKPLVELVTYRPAVPAMPKGVCEECGEETFERYSICTTGCGGRIRSLTGPEKRAWVYRHAVVENTLRHNLVVSLLDPDEPNVVLVNRLDHGAALEEVVPDSIFLQGSDSKKYRAEVMADFRGGGFQNLIATRILDRGSNLMGHAVGIIQASGEGSARQVLQRIGRGLRRAGGKEFVYLRDVLDHGNRYLDTASKKRIRVYKEEGFDMELRD